MGEVKNLYIVPPLMEGYEIVKAAPGMWYLWQHVIPAGTHEQKAMIPVKGPYKQSQNAKEWLRRKRFRDLLAARKRGDDVVWPAIPLYDRDNKPL